MLHELSHGDVRRIVDPASVPYGGTAHAEPTENIIGQDRALRALRFGLQVAGRGYNVFVAGPSGVGKQTSVRAFVRELAAQKPIPDDWCFVHNHREPYEPRAICLPTGKGREFRKDIDRLRDFIGRDIPALFESDEYSSRREEALQEIQEKGLNPNQEIRQKAQEKGFVLQQSMMGTALVPTKDGEPLKEEKLRQLPQEEQNDIERRREELQKEINEIQKRYRKLQREADDKVDELDRTIVKQHMQGFIDDIKEKYDGSGEVSDYLDETQDDVVENIEALKNLTQQDNNQVPPQVKQQMEAAKQRFFNKYRVNVVVDNSRSDGAPVVTELNPTYNNLIGRIEKEMQMGAVSTDFTLVKPGALLRANGGFLVLNIEDVIRNPYSWEGLKRSLRSGELRIEEIQEQLGMMSIKTLRPQAIPLDVKVVLIGRPMLYQLLHRLDPEFHKLFKVKADFDVEMDNHEDRAKSFVGLLASIAQREGTPHLDAGAVAKMLEFAARRAEHQQKISTRFDDVSDLLREAGFWAGEDGSEEISGVHVRRAMDEQIYRAGMIKEKIVELINQGTLLIDTEDSVVGQVNGLSVMQLGDVAFGRPNRITATVAAGRDGVIDIERESTLGGAVHNKGVLILTGFLSNMFARHCGLSMSARLVFEQSYQGVDGDSASSAELYALISALAKQPIKQSIAVTGSVNQNGDIQAIGGVNEKIEGFFDVCGVQGLNDEQGVVIPKSNVQNLMLREDIVEAIKDGAFHVWPVSRIEEGIEILTGAHPGTPRDDGTFLEGTVFHAVEQKLGEFQSVLRSLSGHDGE